MVFGNAGELDEEMPGLARGYGVSISFALKRGGRAVETNILYITSPP